MSRKIRHTICKDSMFDIDMKLENVFMKHYAPNHMLAPKGGSSQKGV